MVTWPCPSAPVNDLHKVTRHHLIQRGKLFNLLSRFLWGENLIAFLNLKNITFSIKVSLTKWRMIIHGHPEPETDFPKTYFFFLTDPKLYWNKDQHNIKEKTRWLLLPEKGKLAVTMYWESTVFCDMVLPYPTNMTVSYLVPSISQNSQVRESLFD